MNGSVWSGQTGLPVLTRTTHVSLDLLPQLEEYASQEESVYDHSTYIPSVGELSSTVVIPHQARENYEPASLLDGRQPKTVSEDNLTDAGHYEHSPSTRHPGSHNPLAIVADIQGEDAITKKRQPFPPLEAIDPCDLDTGKVYNNPVYDMERKRGVTQLSRSSPISMLRRSQKARIKATYSSSKVKDNTDKPPSKILPISEGNKVECTKVVHTERSSPLAMLCGKKKVRATLSMPPTLSPGVEEEQYVSTALENFRDSRHLALPTVRQKRPYNVTRASARTYSEMKVNSHKTCQIPSSQSFMDYSHVMAGSLFEHSTTNDSAIDLPRYQLSLSPTPPSSHDGPSITLEGHEEPIDISYTGHTVDKPASSTHVPVSTPSINSTKLPILNSKPPSDISVKQSVKELRQQFESVSSCSPASPISFSSHPHSTDGALGSSQESMVELVVTDI